MTRAENAARYQANRCEDVAWLIGHDTPDHIAVRVGYANLASLCDQLRRWGRADLVARLRGQGQVAA